MNATRTPTPAQIDETRGNYFIQSETGQVFLSQGTRQEAEYNAADRATGPLVYSERVDSASGLLIAAMLDPICIDADGTLV